MFDEPSVRDGRTTRLLQALDANAVRRWYRGGLAALDVSRDEINSLNVFPVPDADTGTNLHLTLESAVQADAGLPAAPARADLAETALSMARLSLLGARGSSGVILSQLLRGVAEVLAAERLPPRGLGLTRALERAVELAYAAVSHPVEGTMLTVARAAATAARATGSDDLPTVVDAAAEAAREALAQTPQQLDVLGRAGVVDAGGRGVVVLLDVLQAVVHERPLPAIRYPVAHPRLDALVADTSEQAPAYEVMYLLDAPDERVPVLRSSLDRLGDSVVVSGGGGLWHVHVHTDEVGAAVDAGAVAGRPHRVKVTPLHGSDDATHGEHGPDSHAVAVLLARGSPVHALRDVFSEAGAHVVEATPAVADALLSLGNRRLLLLCEAACEAQARACLDVLAGKGLEARLVAARSAAQMLAAVALHDPYRSLDDEALAMTSAVAATRHADVRAHEGQFMAGLEGGDVVVHADAGELAAVLLERMFTDDSEMVTVVASPQLCDRIARRVRDEHPGLDVATIPADIGEVWLGVE